MPKLEQRLAEARDYAVEILWEKKYTAQEIATIFGLTTSMIYSIIKEIKGRDKN